RRFTRDQRAAIAFAAGRIQHAPSARDLGNDAIAMPVLVPDRTTAFRREAFPGKYECCCGIGRGIQSGKVGMSVRRVSASTTPPLYRPPGRSHVERNDDRLVIRGLRLLVDDDVFESLVEPAAQENEIAMQFLAARIHLLVDALRRRMRTARMRHLPCVE